MDINERFILIINELYNGNKRAFSLALGLTPTVIENVVGKRRGKPSFDVIEKVCANANISGDWLILGEGNMLKTEKLPITTEIQSETRSNDLITPLLDRIEAQARKIERLEIELAQYRTVATDG